MLQNDLIFKRAIMSSSPFENVFTVYVLTLAVCETTVIGKPQGCMINLT